MTRKIQTVYLSGGMQYAPMNGAGWRRSFGEWTHNVLGHRVIDPVKASEVLKARWKKNGRPLGRSARVGGHWPDFFRTIVDRDIDMVVRRSDYIVCLWNSGARKGAGTQGELTVARMARKPVYLVSRTSRTKLPGWIQGCLTEHFPNFGELQRFLIKRYNHHATSGEYT